MWAQTQAELAHLHDGEVPVHADAGEEQDAAVHVDEIAEGVQVRAGETRPAAVVEQDAGGQRQVDQQVRHRQVDGVDDGGGLGLGAEAKHVERHRVEHRAHLWAERIQVTHSVAVQLTASAVDLRRCPHQEYEGIHDHQSDPEAVEVAVEPLVEVGQSLKIPLRGTGQTGGAGAGC